VCNGYDRGPAIGEAANVDTLAGVKVGRKLKKTDGREPSPMIFAMRGSLEFRDWMARGAAACGLSVTDLVVQAMRHYLKAQGFKDQPPPR
jgi:hypothetical protein